MTADNPTPKQPDSGDFVGLMELIKSSKVKSTSVVDLNILVPILEQYIAAEKLKARINENAANLRLDNATRSGQWLMDYFSLRDKQLKSELAALRAELGGDVG